MKDAQNQKIMNLFQKGFNYADMEYKTPFVIFTLPASLAVGFFTAYFAPEFTSNFIDVQFLTLSMIVVGFYLVTTIDSIRYKNKVSKLAVSQQEELSIEQKSQLNFIEQIWFHYIEMGPMLAFMQSWFFIVFREIADNKIWIYIWSSLIVWSFLSLIVLLYRRYIFLDSLLKLEDDIDAHLKDLK